MPTRRCALPASRRLDRGDVDLAHLHHGVQDAFGRGSVGAGEGLGRGGGCDGRGTAGIATTAAGAGVDVVRPRVGVPPRSAILPERSAVTLTPCKRACVHYPPLSPSIVAMSFLHIAVMVWQGRSAAARPASVKGLAKAPGVIGH